MINRIIRRLLCHARLLPIPGVGYNLGTRWGMISAENNECELPSFLVNLEEMGSPCGLLLLFHGLLLGRLWVACSFFALGRRSRARHHSSPLANWVASSLRAFWPSSTISRGVVRRYGAAGRGSGLWTVEFNPARRAADFGDLASSPGGAAEALGRTQSVVGRRYFDGGGFECVAVPVRHLVRASDVVVSGKL